MCIMCDLKKAAMARGPNAGAAIRLGVKNGDADKIGKVIATAADHPFLLKYRPVHLWLTARGELGSRLSWWFMGRYIKATCDVPADFNLSNYALAWKADGKEVRLSTIKDSQAMIMAEIKEMMGARVDQILGKQTDQFGLPKVQAIH